MTRSKHDDDNSIVRDVNFCVQWQQTSRAESSRLDVHLIVAISLLSLDLELLVVRPARLLTRARARPAARSSAGRAHELTRL